jgi:hypothetical protein
MCSLTFDDTDAFADAMATLLTLGPRRQRALEAAASASCTLSWATVARTTVTVIQEALAARNVVPMAHPVLLHPSPSIELSTVYLRAMCDDTAMLQHGDHCAPRHEDGYCVDDAARMLPLATELFERTGDEQWFVIATRMMSFLRASAVDGSVELRNFMAWDRRWLDEPHGGDHVGRAIWGLGETSGAGGILHREASLLLDRLTGSVDSSSSTRTVAYSAIGLCAADPQVCPSVEPLLERIAGHMRRWQAPIVGPWCWPEQQLTYDNGRIPESMIRVGMRVGDLELVDRGEALLNWLEALTRRDGYYRFVGHRGLGANSDISWSGDEQPLEACAMAEAHAAMFAVDGDLTHLRAIEQAWSWFLGSNRLGEMLVDVSTGSCCDGLGASGVNLNCGAESTLMFHRVAAARARTRTVAEPERKLVLVDLHS